MQLRISVAELKILALRGKPLPEAIERVESRADVVHIDLDLRKMPSDSRALTLAAKAAGVIRIAARFDDFNPLTQTASFTLTLRARAVPAHRLLNLFTGHVNKILNPAEGAGPLPPGVVAVAQGDGHPIITVDLHAALTDLTEAEDFTGTVRSFTLLEGHVDLDVDWAAEV